MMTCMVLSHPKKAEEGKPGIRVLTHMQNAILAQVPSPLRATSTPVRLLKKEKCPGHQSLAQGRGSIFFSLSVTEEELGSLLNLLFITKVNRTKAVWYSKEIIGYEEEISV